MKATKEQLAELLREFPTWGDAAVTYKARLDAAERDLANALGAFNVLATKVDRCEEEIRCALDEIGLFDSISLNTAVQRLGAIQRILVATLDELAGEPESTIGEHLAEARAVEDHQERKHAARSEEKEQGQ